ncbi:hypothetical protein, partial [uncultured Selenomonas sp.]|uniref:hypothetical protein n=1 Tax=uncultured Selenomonas sp. TaxID=159275 RepID=UPI0028DD0BC0
RDAPLFRETRARAAVYEVNVNGLLYEAGKLCAAVLFLCKDEIYSIMNGFISSALAKKCKSC